MNLSNLQYIFTEQFSSKLYEKKYEIEINDSNNSIFPSNISHHIIEDNYLILTFKKPILKLGYVCSPNGIGENTKIWLQTGTGPLDWHEFEIGKTGMFEFQVESTITVDEEKGFIEKDIGFYIYGIKIPLFNKSSKIDFSIDYSYLNEQIDF